VSAAPGAAGGRTTVTDVDASSPVGTVVSADLDGVPVTVARHEGGWVVVDDECTHAACPFGADGEVFDGYVLACNCHGSEFDLRTGEVLLGPAERALTVRPLVVVEGRLVVADIRPADRR
jgi:nitrite reductase/ring-hydroxylating ferredoxin subunit